MENILVLVVNLKGIPHIKLTKKDNGMLQVAAFTEMSYTKPLFERFNIEDIETLISFIHLRPQLIEVPPDIPYIKDFLSGDTARELVAMVGNILVEGVYAAVNIDLLTKHKCHSITLQKLEEKVKEMH